MDSLFLQTYTQNAHIHIEDSKSFRCHYFHT